ncbi:amino acid permease [Bifidobacterium sp. BRDM6]|uniref:Amino acid permease n=1 Tax=Bifidobacterium choloepi TaxID=2614131 RepID=A0A6I5NPJ6_9BIFI|nr:amino acid permease [Bifidobacterium choloepi]
MTAGADGVVVTDTSDDRAPEASVVSNNRRKVGLVGLIGIVISAMVGGGIYSLPQNMAESASAGGQIIAWAITGVGMWFIANTFRILAAARPELKNGLYTYAYTGFGRFVGFLISYGYWICNCFSLCAYGVLVMSTLNFFFPGTFDGGNNWWSVLGASVITWLMFLLTLRGAKSGAAINVIGTICKIVPVLVFIIAMLTVFELGTFLHGFWGLSSSGVQLSFSFSGVMDQVSGTMLVTLWLFIGIEGAVVVSSNAKSQRDVSRATTLGYLSVLVVYILVSLLPLGVYSYTDIGQMSNPSMATIMRDQFGTWGGVLVNIGVVVSVLAAWLVWMMMISQMPLFGARDGIFPKVFTKTNAKGAPTASLVASAAIVEVLILICHFVSGDAWDTMISITSVMAMPCYLLCCLFLWKISRKSVAGTPDGWPDGIRYSRRYGIATGIIGTVFALYLVYSAGLNYLMIACVVYAVGIPLFFVGRRQAEQPSLGVGAGDRADVAGRHGGWTNLFTHKEFILAIIVLIAGVIGIIYTCHSGVFGA